MVKNQQRKCLRPKHGPWKKVKKGQLGAWYFSKENRDNESPEVRKCKCCPERENKRPVYLEKFRNVARLQDRGLCPKIHRYTHTHTPNNQTQKPREETFVLRENRRFIKRS